MAEVPFCECPCHCGPTDLNDPVGTVLACRRCANAHFAELIEWINERPPLLDKPLQRPPREPPEPYIDGEVGG